MNCADFYNCIHETEEIEARHQARVDHAYFEERARLAGNSTTYNNSTYNNNLNNVLNRISKLEDKVNKLYDMMAECKEKSKPTLFNTITSKDACIISNSNICLTDEQFEKFMNELK